jgi:hypothetical protein
VTRGEVPLTNLDGKRKASRRTRLSTQLASQLQGPRGKEAKGTNNKKFSRDKNRKTLSCPFAPGSLDPFKQTEQSLRKTIYFQIVA